MSDLVERLNNELGWGIGPALLCQEAATEITRLRSEVERLTRERDEARELAQAFSQADKKPEWINRAQAAEAELTTLTARTREVLAPFVEPFVRRRDAYARRYTDTVLGYANFDKMPDRWPMEKIEFLMGEFRAATTLFNELKDA